MQTSASPKHLQSTNDNDNGNENVNENDDDNADGSIFAMSCHEVPTI